jgi:hypothetical protein
MKHSLGASEPANTEPESAAVADDDDAVTSHDGQQGGVLVSGPWGARCGNFMATGMLTGRRLRKLGGAAHGAAGPRNLSFRVKLTRIFKR